MSPTTSSMNVRYTVLPNSPDRSIAYSLTELITNACRLNTLRNRTGHSSEPILVAFVNGLGLPQTFWQPAIELLKLRYGHHQRSHESQKEPECEVILLTYDRHGQGLSLPKTENLLDNPRTNVQAPHRHDLMDSVRELTGIIQYVKETHSVRQVNNSMPEKTIHPRTMLVAHSIGVPLARLYCQTHPGSVSAAILLDSNMANTDFVSLMPDPDLETFDPTVSLPSDTTVQQLRWTRANYQKMFHPSTPNPENLDRSTLATFLPQAGAPVLVGPNNEPVMISVVGHDPEQFTIESLKISTRGLTEQYMQPAWETYNTDLLNIGTAVKGSVVIAEGSGHFIQRDNPHLVAREVWEMLELMNSLKD